MTQKEIAAIAVIIGIILFLIMQQAQIGALRAALKREKILRKSEFRVIKDHICVLWDLWEDIRAAGIPRFTPGDDDGPEN